MIKLLNLLKSVITNETETAKIVYGSSMLPELPRFCLIGTKKFNTYQKGDVVWVETLDEAYHCHRIIQIDDEVVTTRGDNKLYSEFYELRMPISNIKGKVIWHFP